MRIIEQYHEIEEMTPNPLEVIERKGRTCYKSEDRITPVSAIDFCRRILSHDPPHEAMIEHAYVSVRMITDRGVSHEIVRHRLASYAQESTRYCNYSKDKFGNEITVIRPVWLDMESKTSAALVWEGACETAEMNYFDLLEHGWNAQQARSVLPNSLKTEIVMTANMREWRHFFKLRTAPAAHPQMRELAIPILKEFQSRIPVLFDSIGVE